ncbi:SDR family NAD(P)-dependent oxidoreductase [Mycolicibacterium hodleri]|uniref:SDR family oxidoreductase n=1 Tax=Mycolicibacterium hodleri TaxID=49897 RepID=A0A502DLB6_9MYCO|nr:SDR family oxidoreductase [Mycolicibacterium hodleri]TPG25582.1 SDR family oxidoreductase [Mycolicibacterium hodleri]
MAPSLRLDGKRALVTGGGRGIGAAIARRLAAEGATVAVNYRADQRSAQALVDELLADGHRAAAFQADVSEAGQNGDLVQQVVSTFGGLDLLASNAGVEHFGALESITAADFHRVFQSNVAGQLFATQAAAAAMDPGGRILLTSSVSARIAVHHHTLYAASKAAVSAMALNLAPELAERGIAINAIAPGGTATDMAAEHGSNYTPPALSDADPTAILKSMNALGRLAHPDEIAAVASFLLSPDASYLTGATIDAAGGWI